MQDVVEIYTDGACSGNPGPGGWGVILRYRGVEKVLSGAVWDTTNNQMELMAAIQGLAALKRPSKVVLYTDSKYVQKGITEWLPQWKERHWKNAQKKAVKNQALWQQLEKEAARHQIEWKWIKGHNNHVENERADELARFAIEELLKSHKT